MEGKAGVHISLMPSEEAAEGRSRCACGCGRWWDGPVPFLRGLFDVNAWPRPDQSKDKTLAPQWKQHQTRWRYAHALVPYLGPPAHSLVRVFWPVAAVMGVSVALLLLGDAARNHPDPGGILLHLLNMLDVQNVTYDVFRLASFVVSLLLAFRVNRVYDRWWTARCAFAAVGNGVTLITKTAVVWIPDDEVVQKFARWSLAWHYAILQIVTGKTQETDPRVKALLPPAELELYGSTNKPRLLCGNVLNVLAYQAMQAGHIDTQQLAVFEELIYKVSSYYGVAVRAKLQAMPYGLTLYCTGFLLIWLLVLPMALFPDCGWWGMVVMFLAAVLFLGTDDMCTQLEDPFPHMPLEAIVATTARDVPRVIKEVRATQVLMGAQAFKEDADTASGGGKEP